MAASKEPCIMGKQPARLFLPQESEGTALTALQPRDQKETWLGVYFIAENYAADFQ